MTMESIKNNSNNSSQIAYYHRALVGSSLIVLTLIGFLGNALVIIAVIVTEKLRTLTNFLVVNLAFVDFLSCSTFPFHSAGLFSRSGSYPFHEIVCTIVAGVHATCACCSLSSLVAIAFMRWYVITKSVRGRGGIHTPKKIGAVVVFIWIQSVAIMVVPPASGFGTMGYSEKFGICFLADTDPRDNHLLLIFHGTIQAVFLLLILTFYGLILRHVLQHNKKFREKYAAEDAPAEDNTGSNQPRVDLSLDKSVSSRPAPMIKAINKREVEITKNLFTVICVSFSCFLPISVLFIIRYFGVFIVYTYLILNLNSVMNPVLYGLKHPNFQEAFGNILHCRRVSSRNFDLRNKCLQVSFNTQKQRLCKC